MSQRLTSYLAATPELRQLSRTAAQLMALQRYYVQHAIPGLARSSHVQTLESHILTLAADNSAVAAKLRQIAPQLLLLFQNGGHEVTGIQVCVQVTVPPIQPASAPLVIGSAAREHLNELAGELQESPLKDALLRLARNKNRGR